MPLGCFVEVCRSRKLKVNAGKSKVMVMSGEEVHADRVRLEHVSEFSLIGIRRMDRITNAQVRGVLRWFCLVERMEKNRITKKVYVGECAGSCSLDRPKKR